MNSISLITPYFLNGVGKWPNYIDWHLASCERNHTIDFYIFTDDKSISKWENVSNIHIIYMTFEECIDLLKKKLGDVKIDSTYKLCDYRPAFGIVFDEWIKDADFWGFYDCDTILGDLRKFFTDDLLGQYDKLMILGHLQLYRNSYEANHFYELSRPTNSKYVDYNWQKVSQDPNHYGFDEWYGAPLLIKENGKKILIERKNFTNTFKPSSFKKIYDKNIVMNRLFQVWKWEKGALYHVNLLTGKETERLYIHLTQRQLVYREYDNSEKIFLTQTGELKDNVSLADGFVGFGIIKLYAKKIAKWISFKVTHLHGKKSWEL